MSVRLFYSGTLKFFSMSVAALFVLTAMSLWLPLGAQAQEGAIEGAVGDYATQDALPGAHVFLEGTSRGAATAASGSFRIDEVPAGEYTIVASMLGFQKERKRITVRPGETVTVSFLLTEQPIEGSEVLVERTMMTGGRRGVDDVPGSAAYLGARELKRFALSDVNRVLRAVPGVYVQDEEGYGLRPNIGLRGTGLSRSSKVTIMEDGVPMAPAPYSAPAAYFIPTMGRAYALEVRKGSSQVRYGPFTTGGAINFISTPIPSEFTGFAELLAGTENGRRLHAHVGDSYENVGFLVQTFQERTDGFKDLDTGDNTGFTKEDYLAKVRVNTSPGASIYQSLTLKVGHVTERSDETYLGLTESDFELAPFRRYAGSQMDVMKTDQRQYSLQHVMQPASFLDLTTTIYRTEFARNWYKLDRVRASDDTDFVSIGAILGDPSGYADEYAILTGQTSAAEEALSVKNNNREYFAQGVQTVAGLRFDASGLEHDVEIGLRYHVDEIDRFQWIDHYRMDSGVMNRTFSGEPGTESNRVQDATAWAGYVQYRLTSGALSVTPGLRYEHIAMRRKDYGTEDPDDLARLNPPTSERENVLDVWMPGIGLDFELSGALSTFAGVHRGFAPSGPDPETRPEESMNYELGLRYRERGLRAQAVLFYNDYTNLLGADLAAGGGEGTLDQFNGGEAVVRGAELSLDYDVAALMEVPFALPLSLAYTFTDATFRNDFESSFSPWGEVASGDELPYIPRSQLALSLGFESSRFRTYLTGRGASALRTEAGQGPLVEGASLSGHFVMDGSLEYSMSRYVSLFGNIRNISDAVYAVARRPAGLRPGLPRTILLGVRAQF